MSNEAALVPSVLYKYYKPDAWKYLFEDWTIRFSPFTEFNDPFEAMPAFKKIYSEGMRKKLQNMNPQYTDTNLNSIECGSKIKELPSRIQKCFNIGVFCLTPTANNILMWSHYTESHKGFVVGFDMESDFFKLGAKPKQWRPMKVNYLPERHVFDHLSGLTSNELERFLYSKWEMWGYEDEYRMLCSLDDCQEVNGKKGIHSIDKKAIKEVIFGVNMDEKTIIKYCKDIINQENCSHIELMAASINKNKYTLDVRSVNVYTLI